MSVHIVVNGKYTKNCRKSHILSDPERVKKDVENERRKMRIQQVRAASKDIAKQVRNDVEIEKERQLRKIEEIKEKEMEQWRQNIRGQQERHFRSAIFEVGTAHRAAKADNNTRFEMRANQTPKKRLKRPSQLTSKSKQGKENVCRDANAQTHMTGYCCPEPTPCFGQVVACNETSSSDEFLVECDEVNSPDVSSELSSDTNASSSDTFDLIGAKVGKVVTKPTPVIGARGTSSMPTKLGSKGRNEVTQVVTKASPAIEARGTSSMPNKLGTKGRNELGQVALSKKDKLGVSKRPDNMSTVDKAPEVPSTSAAAKKRFTQISDIIRQQSQIDDTEKDSAAHSQQPVSSFRQEKTPTKKSPKSPISKPGSKGTIAPKSPGKPKSKTPSRPTSGQTAATFATKSGSSLQTQRSSNPKVQFFDYNNKFQKQYEQPNDAVEQIDPIASGSQMNAREQAELASRLREARESETEKLRQKCVERCQKAIEREQVRRACEDLTAKLDAITKQRPGLPSDTHQFASHRLERISAQRETKLNNAVEDILMRPAVITCPVVHKQKEKPTPLPADILAKNDLNLGSGLSPNEVNSLNSSDSCCSILLGYVNGQTKQIVDDIQKYSKQNGETDRAKAEKLQNLLTRINRLRESLLIELEKCSASAPADRDRVQNMMDSISEFRREREEIVIDDNTRSSISKRETDLKKKEAILEKKIREFYEMQKTAKENCKEIESNDDVGKRKQSGPKDKNVGSTEESSSFEQHKRSSDINKTENKQKRDSKEHNQVERGSKKEATAESLEKSKEQSKTKKKNTTERGSEDRQHSSGESEEEIVGRRKLVVGENPVEIIIKLKNETKHKKTRKSPPKSPRRLSSLIQSPVVKKNRRGSASMQSSESGSTSYRSLPPTIQNNVGKLLQSSLERDKKTTDVDRQRHSEQENNRREKNQGSHLNPLMAHYVQRLLSMSRNSVNALGVSSSDIDTPSSSIVNTTANMSAADLEESAANRLQQVQKFINENYSFVGELEDSLRQSISSESSRKAIDIIWKKILSEQKNKKKTEQKENRKSRTESTSQRESPKSPPKPTLKKPSMKRKSDSEEIAHVDKSTQLTDNCNQRIAELTAMINKVRREKQKILETTLSSVSENGRNSTEYLELPDIRSNSAESTSRILDSQLVKSAENLPEHSSETAPPQLEKNKTTGLSRDSGISLSRPITAQEARDSPTEELPPRQSSSESMSAKLKAPRPPISIARYSPQLVEDIPHELSTIFEVDTPATSRINTSVRADNGSNAVKLPPVQGSNAITLPPVQDERADEIEYRKFPTFEEYAELHHLDMSQLDPELTTQLEKEFNEFFNLVKEGKVTDYEDVMSFSKYFEKSADSNKKEAAEEFLANLKLANLSVKKFPTSKEYLHNLGVSMSDLLDSQTLENVTVDGSHLNSNSSSTESIMNIQKELKMRNILTKSFEQNLPPESEVSRSNTASVSPKNRQYFNDESGVRQLGAAVSSAASVSPENQQYFNDESGVRQLSTALSSTDDQCDDLENQLKSIGINWPSVMKRKTMETQCLSSTSSSSFSAAAPCPQNRKPTKVSQTVETSFQKETHVCFDSTDGGRRLNLQEFITKELLKRTTTSSSFSYSDDSVASSILRSIIGSMTPNCQQRTNDGRPCLDRHKTSTPMTSRSACSEQGGSRTREGVSSVNFFSGESRLSSVHFNCDSKDTNKSTAKSAGADLCKDL